MAAPNDAGMEDVGDVEHWRGGSPNPNPISPYSSSAAPPPPSLPTSSTQCGTEEDEGRQCRSDPNHPMVKMELDAARTLAEFAQMALLERGNRLGESGANVWGITGRRTRKRISNDPLARACQKRSPDSGISRTNQRDLNIYQDAYSAEYHQQHIRGGNMVEERVKLQQNSESPDTKVKYSRSQASLSTDRAKQNLTEAEKEEKRLRRVYANRESARQTIRRRQVLCEELTKKAADLSRENESMKMEKELALKEYLSLKDENRKLKEKAAKTIKFEVEEGPSETASMQVETPSSSSTKHPPAPIIYSRPPFAQFGMNNESRPTFYMSPYPWFYPIIHQPPKLCSSRVRGEDTNDIIYDLRLTSLHDRSRNDDLKTEIITRERKDGRDQILKPYPTVLMPPPIFLNARSELENYTAVKPVTEVKKMVDAAAAAAEARKRRKELTNLKTLHGGQVGMQC